jgi:hypothetical protein
MSAPLARTKGADLLSQLSEFVAHSKKFLDPQSRSIEVLRWEREIADVMKVNAIEGSFAKAKLAEAHGNIDDVEHWIRNATHLRASLLDTAPNLLVAYGNLGYASRGLKVFRDSVDISRGNIGQCLWLAAGLGAFQVMNQLMLQAERGKVELPERGELMQDLEIASIISKTGVSDDQCAAIIDVAGEVLRKYRLFWLGPQKEFILDRQSSSALMQFRVDANYEDASKMSEEAIKLLIERDLDALPLMINFVGNRA